MVPARQVDLTQKLPTPKYKQPLAEMIQLAGRLRLQNMTTEEILEEVIDKKVTDILEATSDQNEPFSVHQHEQY